MAIRRKDYDISELLDICSKPKSIDERVDLLKQYGATYPELKMFLCVGYFCRDAFSELTSVGPVDYRRAEHMAKGSSHETLKTMWQEITRLYNDFPSGPRIKRGIAHRLLGDLHPDDATLVYDLIFGKFKHKEINEAVVRKAFPDFVPKN